jgi:hypothetical protein
MLTFKFLHKVYYNSLAYFLLVIEWRLDDTLKKVRLHQRLQLSVFRFVKFNIPVYFMCNICVSAYSKYFFLFGAGD